MKAERENEILFMFFGNHPKASKFLYPKGRIVLRAFESKRLWTREELARELGLDLSAELKKKDKAGWLRNRNNFYSVVSTFLGKNVMNVSILVSEKFEGTLSYRISYDTIRNSLRNILKSLHYSYGKYEQDARKMEIEL